MPDAMEQRISVIETRLNNVESRVNSIATEQAVTATQGANMLERLKEHMAASASFQTIVNNKLDNIEKHITENAGQKQGRLSLVAIIATISAVITGVIGAIAAAAGLFK